MTFIALSGSSRAATAAVACSVAALSIAGGLALLVQRHRKRTARSEQKMRTPAFVPEGCQKLVLERGDIFAAFESNLGLPVGTVTFFDFEGADLASCEKHLTEKFRSVVKANPWMAAWTEYDNGTPVMIYPTEVSDTAVDSMLYVRTSPLVLCGEYESVATQVSRFCLPYGKSTIGTSAPLVRLALMPCKLADNAKSQRTADCAVVLFTSHVLGGARTHYRLLHMLSADQPVVSLHATRIPGIYGRSIACLGQDADSWTKTSINHVGSALCSLFAGKPPQIYRLVVCPVKVANAKAKAIAEAEASSVAGSSMSGQQFVSTNDILVSSLACLVGAEVTQMMLDLQPRFADIGEDDIGNYETNILLDYSSAQTPLVVREAVNNINELCRAGAHDRCDNNCSSSRGSSGSGTDATETSPSAGESLRRGKEIHSKPLAVLPPWWKFWCSRHAKITSWVAGARELVLPGCKAVCHSPAGDDPAKLRSMVPYDVIIAFRLSAGKTGLAVVSRSFSKEDYINALPVVDFGHAFE